MAAKKQQKPAPQGSVAARHARTAEKEAAARAERARLVKEAKAAAKS